MRKSIITVILICEIVYFVLSLSDIVHATKLHVDYTEKELIEQDEGMGVVTPEIVLPQKGIYTIDVYLDTRDSDVYISSVATEPDMDNMLGAETVFLENGESHYTYDIYARLSGIAVETQVNTERRNEEGYAKTNRISIDYQKWHSFSYYLITLFFWFGLIDTVVFLCLFKTEDVRSFVKKKGVLFFSFSAVVLLASLPVMVKDIPKGDDLIFHLMRIQGIADGLSSGYFPVKIHDRWFNGYGLPAGVFYGQVLLYPFAVLRMLGFPLGHTYRLYIVFINMVTIALTYLPFRRIMKNRYHAAAVTVFYTMALYRLMDIHKRAAVGEYTAMAFLPMVAMSFAIIYGYIDEKERNKAWIYLAIGMTGILQSHMLTVFMIAIAGVIIVLLNVKKTFCKETLMQYGKAFLLMVLLNLFYIVPFVDYYRSYSLMMKEMKKNIAAKAAYLPQIFSQVYDVNGTNGEHTPIGDMPMSVGVSTLLILAVLLFSVCRYGLESYKRAVRDMMILFSVFLIMASNLFPYDYIRKYARPIYDLLQRVQYPWRFLTILTILCACLFAVSIVLMSSQYGDKVAVIYILLVLSVTVLQSKSLEDSVIHEKSGKSYYSMTDSYWDICEYLPRNTDIEELYDTAILTSNSGVIAGNLTRNGIKSTIEVDNTTSDTGYVQLPQLCYPYYRSVDADGNNLEVIVGDYYKMCFAVPAGYKGTVYTYFREPLIWRIAEFVSLLTVLALLYGFVRYRRSSSL